MPPEADSVQGLPHGARAASPEGMLYRHEAGPVHQDGLLHEARAEEGCLHGDPLRAASRLPPGSGSGVLPGSGVQ